MRYLVTFLILVILGTNYTWLRCYQTLDMNYAQEEGLRDEADTMLRAQSLRLPDPAVYKLSTVEGELMVECLNDADTTVRPVEAFSKLVITCGK